MNTYPDTHLLRRWQHERDALAFKELTRRYGGLVYSAAHRVLANAADAEEVAQECFLKLATTTPEPKHSLGAWLHTVAVRCAIDRVRSEARRRDREATYEAARPDAEVPNFDDLLAHVDEAIAALPPAYRDCIVGHFLRDLEPGQLADELGISRWTVRRRIRDGVTRVRRILEDRGITTGAGSLSATLAGLHAHALPGPVAATLGKVAVAGIDQTKYAGMPAAAGNYIATLGGIIAMKKGIGISVGLVAVLLAAWWYSSARPTVSGPVIAAGVADTSAEEDTTTGAAATGDATAATSVPAAENEAEAKSSGSPDESPSTLQLWQASSPDAGQYAPKPIADPTKYGAIAGLVLDELGRTIPGAHVDVLVYGGPLPTTKNITTLQDTQAISNELWKSDAYRYSAKTDGNGAFLIDEIRYAGTASLVCRAPGYTHSTTSCAVEPETTAEVTLKLNAARAIHGKVVTPSGRPVVGAVVADRGSLTKHRASGMGVSTPEYFRAQTDTQGHFTLWKRYYGVPEEEEFTGIHVRSEEHGEGFFFPIQVGLEERVTLTLKSELGRLEGRILQADGKPAAGYTLRLEGSTTLSMGNISMTDRRQELYVQPTGKEGDYAFEGVATFNEYTAQILTPGGSEIARQPIPKLEAGGTTIWNYTIDPAIHVTGEVRGSGSNEPLSGVTVACTSEGADIYQATQTDAQGAFSFEIVSGPGSYRFVPRYLQNASMGDEEEYEHWEELQADEDAFVALKLPEPWYQSLVIVDPAGGPLEGVGATLNIQYPNGSNLGTNLHETSDLNGFVQIGPLDPAGVAKFYLHLDGFLPEWTTPAAASNDASSAPETIVLYPATSAVARLIDRDGNPVSGALVRCQVSYGDGRTSTVDTATNADGWLIVEDALPASDVQLSFRAVPPGIVNASDYVGSSTYVGPGTRFGAPLSVALGAGIENDLGEVVLDMVMPERPGYE